MDLEEVKNLVAILESSSIDSIMVEEKDKKIKLQKSPNVAAMPAAAAPVSFQAPVLPFGAGTGASAPEAPKQGAKPGDFITSPMVGTFYESPSPDADAFVKPGKTVAKGDKLCILEAMKIFNEIEADFDCKILEILVKDGQIVEYDTPLFRVEKL